MATSERVANVGGRLSLETRFTVFGVRKTVATRIISSLTRSPSAPEPRASTSMVDIDATGRRALDLGPSWVWVVASWAYKPALHVTMARVDDSLRCAVVVEPANFVYEDA